MATPKPKYLGQLIAFSFCQLFVLSFVFYLLSQQTHIQSWDHTIGHTNFVYLHDYLREHNFTQSISEIYSSTYKTEYNLLSSLPLSIVNIWSTDQSRQRFIILTYLVYILPSFFIFYNIVNTIIKVKNTLSFLTINLIFFLNPLIINNLINGQSSFGGTLLIFILINILVKNKCQLTKLSSVQLISIGIILGVLPVLHRWFSFFVLSFLITHTLSGLINKDTFTKHTIRLGLITALSVSTFRLISGNLWIKYLFLDYNNVFQSFRYFDNTLGSINHVFFSIGYIFMFIFIFDTIARKTPFVFYFISYFGLSMLTFLCIQDFSYHHFLLLLPPLLISLSQYTQSLGFKGKMIIIILIFTNFINVFFIKSTINRKIGLLSTYYYQTSYNNIHLLNQLASYLETTPNLTKIYFASINPYFNTSSLSYLSCTVRKIGLCDQIMDSSFVNSRDAFPNDFTKASHVVVTNYEESKYGAVNSIKKFVQNNPQNFKKLSQSFSDDIFIINIYEVTQPLTESQINSLKTDYYL